MDFETLYREERPRALATLIRLLRDFDLAEDVLQEAFAAAFAQWPRGGVPANPCAWLVSTARHKAIDRLRRAKTFAAKQAEIAYSSETASSPSPVDETFPDDLLRQIASLTARGAAEAMLAGSQREASDLAIGDAESRIMIIRLPKDPRPDWFTGNLPPGLHTVSAGPGHLRVFIGDGPSAERTVVAQPTDVRNELAINSALRTLIPLLLLLPVLAWLIVRIVRSELVPVTRLSRNLDAQPADRPQPIADDDLPEEIRSQMEFHLVSNMDEVIKVALEGVPAGAPALAPDVRPVEGGTVAH